MLAGCGMGGSGNGGTSSSPTATAAPTTPAAGVPDGSGRTILVSGFPGSTEEAFRQAVVPVFSELTGADVEFESGGSADRFNKLLAQKESPTVDVFINTAENLIQAGNQGLLAEIDEALVPNMSDLADWARAPFPHGISYGLVRFGFGMRSDLDPPVRSWEELVTRADIQERLGMPILAHSQMPATLIILAELLGGSQDDIDPAIEHLKTLEPVVLTIGWTTWAEQAQSGEMVVTPEFDYQIVEANREGFDFAFEDPTEGSIGTDNSIAIVKRDDNADLAHAFIDVALDPQVQEEFSGIWLGSPANVRATVPAEVAATVRPASEALDDVRFFDPAFIASKRAEWTERLTSEVLPVWE